MDIKLHQKALNKFRYVNFIYNVLLVKISKIILCFQISNILYTFVM